MVKSIVFSLLLLAAPVRADVISVPGRDLNIQTAVDRALPGDVVLVDASSYQPPLFLENVRITSKGISLISTNGSVLLRTVTVDHVPADQTAILRGLHADASWSGSGISGLYLSTNSGAVRIEECVFQGQTGSASGWCDPGSDGCGGGDGTSGDLDSGLGGRPGGYGATISGCSSVVLLRSTASGGAGGSAGPITGGPSSGGSALFVNASSVAAYDSLLRGGPGGSTSGHGYTPEGAHGAAGVHVIGASSVHVAGCVVEGGLGGGGEPAGHGGDALTQLSSAAGTTTLDTRFLAGLGGAGPTPGMDGQDVAIWRGSFDKYPESYRKFWSERSVVDGQTVVLNFDLQHAEDAVVRASIAPRHLSLPDHQGVLLVDAPLLGIPLRLPPGESAVPVKLSNVLTGAGNISLHLQVFFYTPDGGVALGPGSTTRLFPNP